MTVPVSCQVTRALAYLRKSRPRLLGGQPRGRYVTSHKTVAQHHLPREKCGVKALLNTPADGSKAKAERQPPNSIPARSPKFALCGGPAVATIGSLNMPLLELYMTICRGPAVVTTGTTLRYYVVPSRTQREGVYCDYVLRTDCGRSTEVHK